MVSSPLVQTKYITNGIALPTLESKDLDDHSSSSGEYLLVIRKGYLRIQLVMGSPFSWTPVSLPKLAEYHTLSHRVSFLQDNAMWTDFWSELYTNCETYLSAIRQFIMTIYVLPIPLLLF